MDMQRCQMRLALLWSVVSAGLALIMILQTTLGHYADPGAAWGWFIPNVVPTLGLIIGVLVTESRAAGQPSRSAEPFLFWLCFGISAFYLLCLLLVVLLQPLSAGLPLDLMKQSQQFWITPIQGLATAALGAFFVRTKATAAAAETAGPTPGTAGA